MNETTELRFEIYLFKTLEYEQKLPNNSRSGNALSKKRHMLIPLDDIALFKPFKPVPYADTSSYVLEMDILTSILGSRNKQIVANKDKDKITKKAMNLREVLNLQNSEIGHKKSVSISDTRLKFSDICN